VSARLIVAHAKMKRVPFLLMLVCLRLSLGFQASSLTSSFRRKIAPVGKSQRIGQFSAQVSLCSSNNNEDQQEPENEKKGGDIFEKIWESPYSSSFLFWAPFIANEKLRNRFTNFISNNVDLNIAIPLSALGILVAVIYVLYQNILSQIEVANNATNESIQTLREIRKSQMTGGGGGNVETEYQDALKKYENALREELKLRKTIALLPFKDQVEGPDEAAVNIFLGKEINESGDLVP